MNSTTGELPAQPRRSGRRPGASGAREEIAVAAARLFAERGYDRTSLRRVAAAAGVDAALVTHYFGSKQRLFVEVVQFPVDPALVLAQVVEGPREAVGERLARLIVGVMESTEGRARYTGLVRAAASEPEAAAMLRQLLETRLFGPAAAALGSERAELGATLVGAHLVGLVMARHIVGVEPLASATPDELVGALAPVLQHYLTAPLQSAVG